MAESEARKKAEADVTLAQFKRNLDHILINTDEVGPEITIGLDVFTFKPKAPVSALAALIGEENRVDGMRKYLLGSLLPGQDEKFEELLNKIDIDGLGEILNVLGEGYTSFPEKP